VSPYSPHLETKVYLHDVLSQCGVWAMRSRAISTAWLYNHLKTLPLLRECLLHILGGAVRHEKGGLPHWHIREYFCTFKKYSLRNATFGIAFRDCSRTKNIEDHASHLEAQYTGEYFPKLKQKALFHWVR